MTARPLRPLLANALTALEVITDFKVQHIRMLDYELAMSQRGLRQVEYRGALSTFVRRGWVVIEGSTLSLTDEGRLAAARGVGAKADRKQQAGRGGNRRMPAGLF
jgi:hypothetical protein